MTALAIVLLAWLLIGCTLMVADVTELCREQEEEARLDALWDDEDEVAA